MALSRTFLIGLGLTEAQVEAVVEGNEESIKALKATIADLKTKDSESSEKITQLQKELEDTKNQMLEKEGKNPWKVKFEALKEEFEGYKTEEQKKVTKAAKKSAYEALLKEAGIAEKRIAAVLKVSDYEGIEIGEDGKVKDADKLSENIKSEWAEFITTESAQGANTATPPDNNGGGNDGDHSAAKRIAAQRAQLYGAPKTE